MKDNPLKTIHFISLGCPKNRVDSEVMAGIAKDRGLEIVAEPKDADVIVVNTCAFIESAREESVDTLFAADRYRADGRLKLLVSAGCLSQRYSNDLAHEMPELDCVVGTGDLDRIGPVLDGTADRVEIGEKGHFLQKKGTPRLYEALGASAYVKIADGCSRRCAFCAIPAIRGKASSRTVGDIVQEAKQLASVGVKELNLVAQDTSAYGHDLGDDTDLVSLISRLDDVSGIAWVRLLYLYPDAVSKKLLKAMRDSKKVVPYFDIPVQHASAKMLRRMRRGHGPGRIRHLLKRIRETVPDAFLRTAIIVGHPGEADNDFAELLEFIEWARFDHLGAFRYSDEQGTPSCGTGPVVSARDSYNRLRKVMALQRRISRGRIKTLKGKVLEVLVEDTADDQGYVLKGRHQGQAMEVDGVTYIVSSDARVGDIIRARVIKTGDHDIVVERILAHDDGR